MVRIVLDKYFKHLLKKEIIECVKIKSISCDMSHKDKMLLICNTPKLRFLYKPANVLEALISCCFKGVSIPVKLSVRAEFYDKRKGDNL